MRKVHPEFAYQSRELGGQIDGILGDPPNRKNYDMMQQALMSEYADGGGIEDVNMMSFALVDHIRFLNPKGLLAQSVQFDEGDPSSVFAMAACDGDAAAAMYAAMTDHHPELARQAIITAFLFKHPRMWDEDDESLEQLSANDDGDDEHEEDGVADDFAQMFDQDGDE